MTTGATHGPLTSRGFDVAAARKDFPILNARMRGKRLVYLDNAATTQKPQQVIDAIARYYTHENANIHRGVHHLSEHATEQYEAARARIAGFIGAGSEREVVFVRGATEGINLVAAGLRRRIGRGDEILITAMEHHSNIVPWQMLCEETGATLQIAPIDDDGALRMEEFDRLLTSRTKMVAVTHVSNALGTINPVAEIVRAAHSRNALVLIDGAQAVPHLRVNLKALDCDFYVLSAHKLFGPTGVGVLYGKESVLAELPPYQGGGDMIRSVTFERTTYNDLPYKFEAGTPNIAGGIGFGAALEYLERMNWDAIAEHEEDVLRYAESALAAIDGIRLIGTAAAKTGVVSFVLDHVHPHDIGTVLDQEGVAIRTGHHCAQPVMARFGVPATARASFAFYNDHSDVDALVSGVRRVQEVFG